MCAPAQKLAHRCHSEERGISRPDGRRGWPRKRFLAPARNALALRQCQGAVQCSRDTAGGKFMPHASRERDGYLGTTRRRLVSKDRLMDRGDHVKSCAPKPIDGRRVCPWWLCFTFDNPLRRLIHNPKRSCGSGWRRQTAIDIGCGMGYFSLPMARLVGDTGRVIAVDLQDRMLHRAAAAGRAGRSSISHSTASLST